jgi:hypothetical protein
VRVLIKSLEARDIKGSYDGIPSAGSPGAGMFQYELTGIDCVKLAGYFDFFKALAELGAAGSSSPTSSSGGQLRIGDELRITLGCEGTLVVGDGYAQRELFLPPGRVLRLNTAIADVQTAPVGADILLDAEYSIDGGTTWVSVFDDLGLGAVVIPDGVRQMTTPYGQFLGFPAACDLPARCLVRGNVVQIGSGTAGADLGLQLIGEIR